MSNLSQHAAFIVTAKIIVSVTLVIVGFILTMSGSLNDIALHSIGLLLVLIGAPWFISIDDKAEAINKLFS